MRWPWQRRRKSAETGDMRTIPIDNPLDFREDGSVRPGDPAYDFMMGLFDGGGSVGIATQRPDGTWETRVIK